MNQALRNQAKNPPGRARPRTIFGLTGQEPCWIVFHEQSAVVEEPSLTLRFKLRFGENLLFLDGERGLWVSKNLRKNSGLNRAHSPQAVISNNKKRCTKKFFLYETPLVKWLRSVFVQKGVFFVLVEGGSA